MRGQGKQRLKKRREQKQEINLHKAIPKKKRERSKIFFREYRLYKKRTMEEKIYIMEGKFIDLFAGKVVFMMFCDSSSDFEMLHSYCAGLCVVNIIQQGKYVCIGLSNLSLLVHISDYVLPFIAFLRELDSKCDIVEAQVGVINWLQKKYNLELNKTPLDPFMRPVSLYQMKSVMECMNRKYLSKNDAMWSNFLSVGRSGGRVSFVENFSFWRADMLIPAVHAVGHLYCITISRFNAVLIVPTHNF